MATKNFTSTRELKLAPCSRSARSSRKRRLRSEANPASESPIRKLGDDALLEILIRLPNPRSACRSKVVCMRWRSLISSPRFNCCFVSHHQGIIDAKPPVLFPSDDPQSVILGFLPMPLDDRGRRPQCLAVLDSFNDLLLCGFDKRDEPDAELCRSYLICNPFTKQWMALPLAPERPIGYKGLVASLVCEPRSSNSIINLDLGDGQAFAHCSEYRFRVVCIYGHLKSTKLDVFCSESGEWTKEALVLDGFIRDATDETVSCNGVVFLPYVRAQNENAGAYNPFIAAINPFRLDIPLIKVDVSPIFGKRWWNISISKGALHLIVFEEGTTPTDPIIALSVWRLDENCKIWRKVCEGPAKPSSRANYKLHSLCYFASLHPENPEVVFFQHVLSASVDYVSCNLTTGGELEFFESTRQFDDWRVFLPKVSCWPTPIPRYQELRVLYNGSYRCWL